MSGADEALRREVFMRCRLRAGAAQADLDHHGLASDLAPNGAPLASDYNTP